MKYEVEFSCGHTETVDLVGKHDDRRCKIAWFEESWLCSKCYAESKAAEMAETHDLVEMHYSEYKNKYADCKTKSGSYNKQTKTIMVYVPKAEDPIDREAKEIEIKALETAALIVSRAGKEIPEVSREGAEMMRNRVLALLAKTKAKTLVKNKAVFDYDNLLKAAVDATEYKKANK